TKISTLTLLFTQNDKSDPIWPESAQALFKAIILLMLELAYDHGDFSKMNPYSVYTFFVEFIGQKEKWKDPKSMTTAEHTALTEIFEELPAGSPAKNAYAVVKLASGEMLASILATLASNINIFGEDTGIQKLTSRNDINFKELLSETKPCAIFIVTPDDNPARHSLASLFVAQTYEVLVDYTSNPDLCPGGKMKKRVNFILDEFGNMPAIPDMQSKITACLGRNILFYLAVQDLPQL
ncbi:MAG: type IV secretory system conjugative DNA transfer family protein, partial [Ruminococcus sp.]|nr:type IV secretory system conjugative DNA transfer family protein [Ruminococcus sp.]